MIAVRVRLLHVTTIHTGLQCLAAVLERPQYLALTAVRGRLWYLTTILVRMGSQCLTNFTRS